MIYCVRCVSLLRAQDKARTYIKEFKLQIDKVKRFQQRPVIFLKNGDEIHFVTTFEYRKWCLGKTYKIIGDDKLYHGGYPIKSETSS